MMASPADASISMRSNAQFVLSQIAHFPDFGGWQVIALAIDIVAQISAGGRLDSGYKDFNRRIIATAVLMCSNSVYQALGSLLPRGNDLRAVPVRAGGLRVARLPD